MQYISFSFDRGVRGSLNQMSSAWNSPIDAQIWIINQMRDCATSKPCRLEQLTAGNTGMQLTVAMSFSGRADIARAARRIAEKAAQGLLDPSEVSGADELDCSTWIGLSPRTLCIDTCLSDTMTFILQNARLTNSFSGITSLWTPWLIRLVRLIC